MKWGTCRKTIPTGSTCSSSWRQQQEALTALPLATKRSNVCWWFRFIKKMQNKSELPHFAVLSWLSCLGCPVLAVLSWLSCPGCSAIVFLSQFSCPSCLVLAVMFWRCHGAQSRTNRIQNYLLWLSWIRIRKPYWIRIRIQNYCENNHLHLCELNLYYKLNKPLFNYLILWIYFMKTEFLLYMNFLRRKKR